MMTPKSEKCLEGSFKTAEYEGVIAPDGYAALKLHRANPADLIITDIAMPEEEGLETILEFRGRSPAVRIISISGGGEIESHNHLKTARAMGSRKTFPKPLEPGKLPDPVRELLQNDPPRKNERKDCGSEERAIFP
jgi:DNA-binding response OmpR family regulator